MAAMRGPVSFLPPGTIWSAWYVWRLVFPLDDHGALRLDDVWHSGLTGFAKLREALT